MKPTKQIKIFHACSNDKRDREYLLELRKQLSILKQFGLIDDWSDSDIPPGKERNNEIDKPLNSAEIMLFFVSSDFMASELFHRIEQRAMQRHINGDTLVIPIYLRHISSWEMTSFAKLPYLPKKGVPVRGQRLDAIFRDIAQGIEEAVYQLLTNYWLRELIEKDRQIAKTACNEALFIFEQALNQNASNISAHHGKGKALFGLEKYQSALDAFEETILLNPNLASAYFDKGRTLEMLGEYGDALCNINEAIRLDSSKAEYFRYQGDFLKILGEAEEAIMAYNYALSLDPNYCIVHYNKGCILFTLKRHIEALTPFKHVIRLDRKHSKAH